MKIAPENFKNILRINPYVFTFRTLSVPEDAEKKSQTATLIMFEFLRSRFLPKTDVCGS